MSEQRSSPRRVESNSAQESFEHATQTTRPSLLRDGIAYLRETRKLWLAPLIVLLLVLGLVLSLSSSVLSPLIYTLF